MTKRKYRTKIELIESRQQRMRMMRLHHIPEEYRFRAMALVRDYVMDLHQVSMNAMRAQFKEEMSEHLKLEAKMVKSLKSETDELMFEWKELLNETLGLEGEDFVRDALDERLDIEWKECPFCRSNIPES